MMSIYAIFQTSVYNILPPTTAVIGYAVIGYAIIGYAIGLQKASAGEVFHCAQMPGCLEPQTVQIISALVTSHNAYTSTNETKIVQIKLELIFLPGGDAPSVVHTCLDAMWLPQSALKLSANFTNGADGSKHEKVQKKGDFPKNLHIVCPCHNK